MSSGWYPIINYDLCSACRVCVEFCPNGVYVLSEDGYPVVAEPEKCIHGCHGCENQCLLEAIGYFGDLPGHKTGGLYKLNF